MWADEIKIAHLVLPRFFPDLVEEHATLFELVDNSLLAIFSIPHDEKVVEGVVFASNVLASIILQAFGHQVARNRIVLDSLGNDLNGNTVNVVLDTTVPIIIGIRPIVRTGNEGDIERAVELVLVGDHGAIGSWLENLDRLAIECGIGEHAGGIAEVKDSEVQLSVRFANARASADNLLELGHALLAVHVVKHNDLAGLAVHASGEQFRSSDNGRVFLVGIDELVELRLTLLRICR